MNYIKHNGKLYKEVEVQTLSKKELRKIINQAEDFNTKPGLTTRTSSFPFDDVQLNDGIGRIDTSGLVILKDLYDD